MHNSWLVPVLWYSEVSVVNFTLKFCPDIFSDFARVANSTRLKIALKTTSEFWVEELSTPLPSSVYTTEDEYIDWVLVYLSQLLNSISKKSMKDTNSGDH